MRFPRAYLGFSAEERRFMRGLVQVGIDLGRENPTASTANDDALIDSGLDRFVAAEVTRQLGNLLG